MNRYEQTTGFSKEREVKSILEGAEQELREIDRRLIRLDEEEEALIARRAELMRAIKVVENKLENELKSIM